MKQPKIPTVTEMKEVLGLQALSPLSLITQKYNTNSKPLLFNG